MKIVHVITRFLRAGSEENTLASCLAQAEAGHEVYLVHGKDYDPSYYEMRRNTVQFHRIAALVHPIAPVDDLRALRALTKLLKRLSPNIVHTHQSKAGIVGRFAARAAGVPTIVHGVHIAPFVNVGPIQRSFYLGAERAAAGVTDAFINVSQGMRDVCIANNVGRPDQHFVVHSGFDVDRFRRAMPLSNWRALLKVDENAPKPAVIVMAAALEARKRQLEFVAEFPSVIERFPDVRLVLCGEGPLRGKLEAMIRQLGLERHVILTGHRHDVEQIIALADVCVLTSTREGLPRVIMQYLAAGKACVASALPGLEEILRVGVNGLVTPPDDVGAAARTCIELLAQPERRENLAQGARDTNLTSWDVAYMGTRIGEVYAQVARSA